MFVSLFQVSFFVPRTNYARNLALLEHTTVGPMKPATVKARVSACGVLRPPWPRSCEMMREDCLYPHQVRQECVRSVMRIA